MAFKIVVSDPKSRKAYQKEAEENASGLVGKKIGEMVSGGFLGMEGYELEITGGSDREGFPMRSDVDGQGRKRVVLAFPPGFHPARQGERKRKSIRGNTISRDISQINMRVVKPGKKPLDAVFGAKERPSEGKREEGKEAPKEGERPSEGKREGTKAGEKREEAKPRGKPKEEAAKEAPEQKMGVKTLEEREKEAPREGKNPHAGGGKKTEKQGK